MLHGGDGNTWDICETQPIPLSRTVASHTSADAFTLSGMSIATVRNRVYRAPASKRWIALLVASVLLHFVFLGLINGNISMPSLRTQAPATITAQLLPIQQSEPVIPAKPKSMRPKRAAKPIPPRQVTTAPPEIVTATQGESASPPSVMEIPEFDLAQFSETLPAPENETPPSEIPKSETQTIAAAEPELQSYKVSIPPSAELKYDVQALRDDQMVYGSGKISFQSDGGNYTVDGEASILFFTLLNFKSTGVIDDSGIAPVIYSEKRFRRPATNTHFHRERDTISFSASTVTYPRKGGEQDRASIIWQLTGIGRGDGEKFQPGAELDFFVAGVRDAAAWRVRVIGEEQIEIGSGKVNAWHVVRIPKPGTYDQKLDIWLAPQHEWYPVKLRFTETNGEYLDMLLSNLTIVAAN